MVNVKRKDYALFGLVLLFSAILVVAWFYPLNYHVFIGDDLYWMQLFNFSRPLDGFWHNAFTIGSVSGKFRPIPTALALMATEACRNNFDCFVGINFFMIAANAFLASIIAYKMSFKWMPIVFIGSTVIILSRFSYYAALQMPGIMENLAMTFVLLLVLCFVDFMRSAKAGWMAAIIILFFLVLFTHERFIVLIVPVVFSLFARRRELKTPKFIFFLFTLLLTISAYFLIREYVFHARFLTGAETSSIVDTFNISQVMFFISQGTLNLFGFNAGPDYFSGKYFLNAGAGGIIVGIFLSATLVVLLYMFLKQQINKKSDIEFDLAVVLILMIGGMILSSSITFRQEYRWLYAPFAVFVLLVCFILGKIENIKAKYILAIMVAVSFASVDIFYRQYMNNLYFIQGSQMASTLKREIIDKYSRPELAQKEIFLLLDDGALKNWVLADGYFFEIYAPEVQVHFVKDLNGIPLNSIKGNHLLLFSINGTQVVGIPQEALQDQNMAFRYKIVEYDFVSKFSSAIWDNTNLVSTPNGHGVFPMSWQDNFGLASSTITVISPYDILFPSITCKEGSKLIFSAGIPYASGDGADLSVDLGRKGKQKEILNVSLDPAKTDGIVTWSDYVVSLTDCAEEPIDIKFDVSSPSGNTAADWVAITNVKIVIDK